MTRARVDFDIAIVGAGAVGATLAALAVRQAGVAAARVLLIERDEPRPWDAAEYDLRVFALSPASARILDAAGAWPAIAAARVSPYERMRVWHASVAPDSEAVLTFDAAELSQPNLGYIVENTLLQTALLESLRSLQMRVLHAGLESLVFADDHVAVATSAGTFAAKVVIGADGAKSRVRELAGFGTKLRDYSQHALVAMVSTEHGHRQTAWQRFLGHGTLAFLPLANGQCSIVWSLVDEQADRLMNCPAEEFQRELAAALDGALGQVRLESRRIRLPLAALSADRYVFERCALLGDAAHTVHPLAGQGVNLGLLDAAVMADEFARARLEREDYGALRVLRRYERARRPENELMIAMLSAFNGLLAVGANPLARLAQRGLGVVNHIGPLKRIFAGRALGTGGLPGALPTAARPRGSRVN